MKEMSLSESVTIEALFYFPKLSVAMIAYSIKVAVVNFLILVSIRNKKLISSICRASFSIAGGMKVL